MKPDSKREFVYLMDGDLNCLGAKVADYLQRGWVPQGDLVIQYRGGETMGFIQAVVFWNF